MQDADEPTLVRSKGKTSTCQPRLVVLFVYVKYKFLFAHIVPLAKKEKFYESKDDHKTSHLFSFPSVSFRTDLVLLSKSCQPCLKILSSARQKRSPFLALFRGPVKDVLFGPRAYRGLRAEKCKNDKSNKHFRKSAKNHVPSVTRWKFHSEIEFRSEKFR